MNQNIIIQYQIEFENKVMNFETGKEIYKTLNTNNKYLFEFLVDWRSAEDITNYLLAEIDLVLNGIEPELETGSETVSISIYIDKVKFYDNNFNYVGDMPTEDFKEICEGWRDFLLSSPFNGTKIL